MAWTAQLMGEVALKSDGALVPIGGSKQRVLVAALALSPGRVVGIDRLIDLIWGDDPPATARKTLQSYVSRLRTALGVDGPVRAEATGYIIDLARSEVDLLALEDEANESFQLLADDPAVAADQLGLIVEGWAEPVAGLRLSDQMSAVVAPFHTLYGQVLEHRCTALVDSGDSRSAVRLLEDLTRADSTNEKLWFELARGLIQLGRRRHALDALQRAREALRHELGVGLSPQLAQLEVEVLEGTAPDTGPPREPDRVHGVEEPRNDNLRPESNAFVNRLEVVEKIEDRLAPGKVISIVGPGGIGKTRCALEVGRRSTGDERWPDGVWFVDLTALPPDDGDIAPAIATAIGMGRQGTASTTDSVVDYFTARTALLILDNCEHVQTAAVAFVAALLANCPGAAVIATTRVRLALPAEHTIELGPMTQSESVELFMARAAQAGAGTLSLPDVEDLCATLDNYPLALELAAARTRALSVREIVDRLERHPRLALERVTLDAGPTSARDGRSTRHTSFFIALDWSLEQLPPRAKDTLCRLTVFGSDFDLAAAESIAMGSDISEADVVDHLGVLVEHHLLMREHDRSRFVMLEPIRQTLLSDSPPAAEFPHQHCEYFADLASVIGLGVLERDEAASWARFEAERSNLRDAVTFAAEHGDVKLLEIAMRSMALVVLVGGEIGPAAWAEDALTRIGVGPGETPYTTLAAAAGRALALRLDECDEAIDELDRSQLDPRALAVLHYVRMHRHPSEASKWYGPMLDAALAADDQPLMTLARVRALDPAAIRLADVHGNPSMKSSARLFTYATLPSEEQPQNLNLVDECYELALASNNELTLIQALVPRGTSRSRTGDVAVGTPALLESLDRTLRRRTPQHVWTVIEAIATLLPVMHREPETSAALWAAVDATEFAPVTRVIRQPDRPIWVAAQLGAEQLERARAYGATLDMDAAARETRKAVERFLAPDSS